MANFRIVFNRKKQTDINGNALIEFSITLNGKRIFKSTGFRVKVNQFNEDSQKVVNHPKAAQINAVLSQILSSYQQREVDLLAKMQPYTLYDIVSDDNDNKLVTFLEFARKEAEGRNTSYKSKNLYFKVIELLNDFVGHDFYFDKINLKFIRDFDKFLYEKKYHPNSVAKRHTILKMFINAAIRDGYMETHHNPYLNFQIKKIPSVRRALEAEQLSALEVLEVPENLELIKDMFLFSCYTGLRYSDMISLKQKDIVRSGEGVYLNIRELKTKKLKQNIPLHVLFGGKAVSIIDKYFNKYRDTVFQNFTDQHINRCLKIIGMMLKLDFPLTFHCSRHTFGTMLAEKTQDPYLIKEMMNHSDLKTSMIYIHSSKKRIENTLKKVDWSL